jgi:hypothetical protein
MTEQGGRKTDMHFLHETDTQRQGNAETNDGIRQFPLSLRMYKEYVVGFISGRTKYAQVLLFFFFFAYLHIHSFLIPQPSASFATEFPSLQVIGRT